MRAGEVVGGRFQIERHVATGGMGSIFRALDLKNHEPIALKVTREEATPNEIERFAREAEILAELSHPGLVRYIGHGSTHERITWLAMEWLEGESLADRLERGPLTVLEGVKLGRRVAEALAAAHARGVVHRDIKPDNIYLPGGEAENVKVIDFGIARFQLSQPITRTGVMIGTPRYIAPEQVRGARELDPRADVFSLGCVLYECFAGRRAFQGDEVMAVLAKVLLEDPPRLKEVRTEVPSTIEELVARMMSKEPARRPVDCTVVAAELAAVEARSAEAPRTLPPKPRARLGKTEQRFVSVVLAALPQDLAADPDAVESLPTERIARTLEPFGAELGMIADGTLVASLQANTNALDQAANAARAALAMRAIVPSYPMVLSSGRGVLDRSVPLGDVIDTAADLLRAEFEASVHPGLRPIRLDEVTAGLLDTRFDVAGDDLGLVLRGEKDVAEAARTLCGRPTPCVGRERELLTLESVFAECIAEPVARAVVVTANAGFGKSRLRYELLQKIRQTYGPTEIWISRGDAIGQHSPFHMLIQPLRRMAGILEGEPLPTQQHKMRARVARHVQSGERARITEFLGELVGVPFPDHQRRDLRAARHDVRLMGEQMRRAWVDFVAYECAAQPVLLVLEDLHWGDLPSVRFIDSALSMLPDRPLMVLAFARPELDELFPKLWEDRGVQRVRLGKLSRNAAEKLARMVLDEVVEDSVIKELVERSGGNAFYLEELIRAAAEGSKDPMPETVLAMVQMRLNRLDPELRQVLRAASVFGQSFWTGGVNALVGRDVEALLAQLEAMEVIVRQREAKFPDQEQWTCRHALVREAAYGMLTPDDRALGHRLAGGWLLRVGESDAAVLAEHFERGGEPARAVAWYGRAAEQAFEGNDFDAAVACAERAVTCGADGDALAGARLIQAQAHEWRGRHADAETSALAAMRMFERGQPGWYGAAGEAALASGRLGDHAVLGDLLRELGGPPLDGGALSEYVSAASRLAIQLLLAGSTGQGDELIATIDGFSRMFTSEQVDVAAHIDMARGVRALFLGDAAHARAQLTSAAARFERAGDSRMACAQRLLVSSASIELGAYAQAEAELREVIAGAVRLGLHDVGYTGRFYLGFALARIGYYEEAIQLERDVIDNYRTQGDPRMEASAHTYLARILLSMGDVDRALAEAKTAADVGAIVPPTHARALAVLGLVRLAQQRWDLALRHAGDAMGILDSLGGVDGDESLIRLVFAEAVWGSRDDQGAAAALAQARDRVLTRAGRIKDPELRRSFLEVSENARTLALAREWLGG